MYFIRIKQTILDWAECSSENCTLPEIENIAIGNDGKFHCPACNLELDKFSGNVYHHLKYITDNLETLRYMAADYTLCDCWVINNRCEECKDWDWPWIIGDLGKPIDDCVYEVLEIENALIDLNLDAVDTCDWGSHIVPPIRAYGKSPYNSKIKHSRDEEGDFFFDDDYEVFTGGISPLNHFKNKKWINLAKFVKSKMVKK